MRRNIPADYHDDYLRSAVSDYGFMRTLLRLLMVAVH
jgi:hypothetical protein